MANGPQMVTEQVTRGLLAETELPPSADAAIVAATVGGDG